MKKVAWCWIKISNLPDNCDWRSADLDSLKECKKIKVEGLNATFLTMEVLTVAFTMPMVMSLIDMSERDKFLCMESDSNNCGKVPTKGQFYSAELKVKLTEVSMEKL